MRGAVKIKGAKNSLLALIPASLLVEGKTRFKNVCHISDVEKALVIMKKIGVKCNKKIEIINKGKFRFNIDGNVSSTYRASYYFMGALLATKGCVVIDYPGGCPIGERPINIHLEGFKKMGCSIVEENNTLTIKGRPVGAIIDVNRSVGATINLMLAGARAWGKTELINPAIEPEVSDVIAYLRKAGYDIVLKKSIIINGKREIKSDVVHYVIPDRIEAITYIVLGILLGEVKVKNINDKHMQQPLYLLIKSGAKIKFGKNYIIAKQSRLSPMNISSDYYPGFPTDLQQIFTTLLTVSNGVSLVTENIFESRFQNCFELNKMGADISVNGKTIVIKGVDELFGKRVIGTDLRGTMSLVIAGLISKGITTVENEHHVERGYDRFLKKIKSLGGKIKKVK